MKNILIAVTSFLLWAGADVKEKQAIEVVQKGKTDSLENVIATVYKKESIEPCKEIPCDSNSYFNKGIAEGLRHCPIHKDRPCPKCPECDTTGLKVFGYDIKGDLVLVRTNKGIGETKLKHEIKVK